MVALPVALVFVAVTCRVCNKPIATTDGAVVRAETERGGYVETAHTAVIRCHRRRIIHGGWRECGAMNRVAPGERTGRLLG